MNGQSTQRFRGSEVQKFKSFTPPILQLLRGGIRWSFCTFALMLFSYAYAQTPVQVPQIPVETSEETPTAEQKKPAMKIEVKDSLLSVELTDAEFGHVIKEIAEKANFKWEVSTAIAHKKINTTFKDVDVEKGIRRLLTIIKEKDYTISYNSAGMIDKLTIYGGSVVTKPASTPPPRKPQPTQKPSQKSTTQQPVTPTPSKSPQSNPLQQNNP